MGVELVCKGLHLLRLANHQRQQGTRHGHGGDRLMQVAVIFQLAPDQGFGQIHRGKAADLPQIVQGKGVQAHAAIRIKHPLKQVPQQGNGLTGTVHLRQAANGSRVAGNDGQTAQVDIFQRVQQGIIRIVLQRGQGRVASSLNGGDLFIQRGGHGFRQRGIFQQRNVHPVYKPVHQGRGKGVQAVVHPFPGKGGKHRGHGINGQSEHIPPHGSGSGQPLGRQVCVRQALVPIAQKPHPGFFRRREHTAQQGFVPAHRILKPVMKAALPVFPAGMGVQTVLTGIDSAHGLAGVQPYIHLGGRILHRRLFRWPRFLLVGNGVQQAQVRQDVRAAAAGQQQAAKQQQCQKPTHGYSSDSSFRRARASACA